MELLIRSNTTSLAEIEKEIGALQTALCSTLSATAEKKLNDELEGDFQRWEKDIVAFKTKKYQRDVLDYKNNHVYKWKKRQSVQFKSSQRGSFSSASSMDEEPACSSQPNNTFNDRLGLGKMGNRRGKNKRRFTPPQSLEKKAKPTNRLEVMNLSDRVLTKDQLGVLGLGLTFVPTNSFNYFTAMKDTQLFLRKVILRKLHFKSRDDVGLDTTLEQEALAALEELAEEADAPPTVFFISAFFIFVTLNEPGASDCCLSYFIGWYVWEHWRNLHLTDKFYMA
ncbi:uncharacterized protein [Ranitomeya imitator]|uniref:uncharacterized protein isoform X2 n=1 Tax=Ranitomeya imitator TaxID=111125 RepID=UPI0037E8DED7